MSAIFLSHASADREFALRLKRWLVSRGHTVFLDLDPEAGIPAGVSWEAELYTKLRRCRALIAVVSLKWIESHWCFAEAAQASALGKPIFPLQIEALSVADWLKAPPAVRSHQKIDLRDYEDEGLAKLERGLLRAGLDPKESFDWDNTRAPYPGLASFDDKDAAVFFGRDDLVTMCLAAFNRCRAPSRARLLLLAGASGSGKSSLLKAGVLPRLARDAEAWIVLPPFRPTDDPYREFGEVVARWFQQYDASQADHWRRTFQVQGAVEPADVQATTKFVVDFLEVASEMRRISAKLNASVLIVLDQLEEALVPGNDSLAAIFLKGLRDALLASDHRILLGATLRADFLGVFQRHPAFRLPGAGDAELPYDVISVGPLSKGGFYEIIEKPAEIAALSLEQGLAGRMVEDAATDDALPLLAFALREMWDRWGRTSGKLLVSQYKDGLGGLEGSIGRRAEELLSAAKPAVSAKEEAAFREEITTRLLEIQNDGKVVRRRSLRDDVAADARRLMREFVNARLLVTDRDHEGRATIEVTHEALFRTWPKLGKWIEEDRAWLARRARLLRRLGELGVDIAAKDAPLLASGPDLEDGKLLLQHVSGVSERDSSLLSYLKRCLEAEQRRIRDEEVARAERERLLKENAQRAEELAASERANSENQRKGRERLRRALVAMAGAFVLSIGAAGVAVFFYTDSAENLTLAHLTRAEQLIAEDRPRQARVLAESGKRRTNVGEITGLAGLSSLAGLSTRNDEEQIRIETIHKITSTVATTPQRTLKSSSPATASSFDRQRSRFAVSYANGDVVVFSGTGERSQLLLKGHAVRVDAIDFLNGRDYLVSSTGAEVILWNLKAGSGQVLCSEGGLTDLSTHPGGRYVSWTTRTGRVAIWDLDTSQLVTLEGHTGWAHAVSFSADGSAIASIDEKGLIIVRETSSWTPIAKIETGRADVWSLALSQDGKHVATAHMPGPVEIWKVPPSTAERRGEPMLLPLPEDKRWKVRFSPDGRFLAVTSWRGTTSLFDAKALTPLGTIDGHDHRVHDASFGPDGQLLTVSESGSSKLWDVNAVRPVFHSFRVDHRETIVGRYSPNGRMFVTGGADGIARLYNIEVDGRMSYRCEVSHQNWIIGAAFSADSAEVVSLSIVEGPSERALKVWGAADCKELGVVMERTGTFVRGVAYHPSTRTLAWGGREGTITVASVGVSADRSMLVGKHTAEIAELDFSKDGNYLVSGGSDGRVVLWNLTTKAATVLRDGGSHINTVKISPDGRWVVAGGDGDHVFVWDVARPDAPRTDLLARGGTNRAAFDGQSQRLAIGSDARYISMWTLPDFRKSFQLNVLAGVRSVYGFHPHTGDLAFDGGDGIVRVLPARATHDPSPPDVKVRGVAVMFDEASSNVGGQHARDVATANRTCLKPQGQ